jgi:signal transduction histidine kinase
VSAARRWSIRSWLGSLAAAVALPLLILLSSLFALEIRTERAEARDSALRVARATAAQLQAMHADAMGLLGRMARRPGLQRAGAAGCDTLFAVVDFSPHDENLYYFERGGRLVCAGTPDEELDRALSDRAAQWIGAAIGEGRLHPAHPIIRIAGRKWLAASVMQVPSEGDVAGGFIALLQIAPIVGIEGLPPDSVITLLDRDGVIVARSNQPEEWEGRRVRETALADVALNENEGRAEALGLDSVERQYGFTFVPELGWHVYAGIPTGAVMQPLRRLIVRGVLGGAAIVAIVILAALLLARRIQKPIDALARAAGSIAGGTYGTVTVEGPREIAFLAETFNSMVTSHAVSEARLRESERNLHALSERILAVQEEERTRIAREIHDELGQSLSALKMDVIGLLDASDAGGGPASRGASAAVRARIVDTLDTTVTAVQRIAAELRPTILADLGLAAAVEAEARLFEERTGIECALSIPPDDETALELSAATALYRIIQESLTNVLRHSDATRVELHIRREGNELRLEVRDDGRGMTAAEIEDSASLGLIGIRERAARLGGSAEFGGTPGAGSVVTVCFPVPAGVTA